MAEVRFTKHAKEKFSILERYGFKVTKKQVLGTIENPEFIDKISRSPLLIAQRAIDKKRVLRVVYKIENRRKVVITFYPGRVKQYGKND